MNKKHETDFFDIFGTGHDRFGFPEGIHRVTAGHGGEAILICGSEKTALLDCGMAYCGDELVENLRQSLSGRTLDYILLSHSHYDHIGALPYVKRAYPEAVVYGAEKAQSILIRPGARQLMKDLGETARDKYEPGSQREIITDGLAVEKVIKEGDEISLGNEKFVVLETKGHTDCSLTFVLEPMGMMFASESTGILEKIDYVHTPILKSYEDAMESFEKCKAYGPKTIVLPHFGMIPEDFNETYWNFFEKEVENKRVYLRGLVKEGLSEDEIFRQYAAKYWDPIKEQEQPYEAFMINSKNIVKVLLKSLD
ncbi:MBL fold metallo-hydrolase [Anaerovorax odorimutans]|uniref:MBL fold metallo-hydrolase n=1 Tax=Anaerovorax odorimutans TaxID=109327 RepID=A0ABT1RLC2_9FIRM|nr:MBL fold metallo-hydrolase [Anaerovorax odorimutans]MCQ4635984.1 MBL fold metallo-hydrolase [Anaerovorax odorimutans]